MGIVAHPLATRARLRFAMLAAVFGLAACARPGQDPGPGLRGYGTPDVSAYVPESQATRLHALLHRCARASSQPSPASATQGLSAACDQLRHTLHNQPGNGIQAPAL